MTWRRFLTLVVAGILLALMARCLAIVTSAMPIDGDGGAPGVLLGPPFGGDVPYVWSLTEAPIRMPGEMAAAASAVWLGCEVAAENQREYGDVTAVVGRLGERGQAQVHPVHATGMARAALDFGQEHDRLLWALRIWERSGWAPWSCKPTAEGRR